jgi:CRP/FNR family cyclic AMP-dependent transcriptional regulator
LLQRLLSIGLKAGPKARAGNPVVGAMSGKSAVISFLSQSGLFAGLGDAELATLAARFKERQFAKGETVFLRGDRGEHLYLVETGRVRLAISTADGRNLSFRHATEGDLFGEIAALDGDPRTADATAIAKARIHCLERHAFRDLWANHPAIAIRIVEFLCRRLRETTAQLETIALQPLDVRLARFLLSALGSRRAAPGKRVPLELGFSQGELSQLLGASRPKVNAAMASLEKAGAVGRTLDRLFCDPEKLARFARHQHEAKWLRQITAT